MKCQTDVTGYNCINLSNAISNWFDVIGVNPCDFSRKIKVNSSTIVST